MRNIVLILLLLAEIKSFAQWVPVIENSQQPILDIIGTPKNNLLISNLNDNSALEKKYLKYSDDGGANWKVLPAIKYSLQNLPIGILGRQGQNIYAFSTIGILKSIDEGDSWTLKPISTNNSYFRKFSSSNKLAVFSNSDSNGNLIISEDNGETWKMVNLPTSYITGIALKSDTIFVSSQYKVLKGLKVNGVWNWQDVKIIGSGYSTDYSGIEVFPNSKTMVVSSKTNGAFFTSKDNGNSWSTTYGLINAQKLNETSTEHVYTFGKYLFLVTPKHSGKIFVSEDKGVTWRDFSAGLPKPYVTYTRIFEVPISKLYLVNDILFVTIGNSLWKRPMNEFFEDYLETPTFLKADTTNRNTHIISWLDNSEHEQGVIVEKSVDNINNFKEIGKSSANATSFTDYNQEGGKTYYYRLTTFNQTKKSRTSEVLQFKREPNYCKVEKKLVYSLGIQSPVFVSSTKGFAFCGDSDTRFLITTNDGGESWKRLNSNYNFQNSSKIVFLNSQIGFILGLFETSYISTDGGETWQRNNNKTFTKYYNQLKTKVVLSEFFINDSTGFKSDQNSNFIKTINYGKTWISAGQSFRYVQNIYFLDSKNGFINDYSSAYKTTNGGNNWSKIEFPFPISNINNLSSPDGKTIYYTGLRSSDKSSFIAISKDKGETFEIIDINLELGGQVTNICFSDGKAWLTSSKSDFYVSEDGYKTWKILSDHPNLYRVNMSFNQEWGLIGFDDYLGRDNSYNVSFMTYDGGISWKKLNLKTKGFNPYQPKVKIFDNVNAAVLSEEYILKTSDKGKTWTEIKTPFQFNIPGGRILDANFVTMKYWQIIYRKNGENDFFLYKTSDGGITWQVQPQVISPYDMLYFYDENFGFVRGNGSGLFHTTNGGNDWRKLNITLPPNSAISSIYFKNKKEGFIGAGAFNKAIILKSDNSGETWRDIKIPEEYGVLGGINKIDFLNDKIGYAITQYGSLYTSDGGNTWLKINYLDFLTKYASLYNFDESYFERGSGNAVAPIYKFSPVSAPPKPHSPNGEIDACISNTSSFFYIDDKKESSFEWKLSGGGNLVENRNQALIKWNSLGSFKLSVRAINNCGISEWQESDIKTNQSGTNPKLISGDLSPCSTKDTEYKFAIIPGETFEWKFPSNAIFQTNKETAILKAKQGIFNYKIGVVSKLKDCPSDTLYLNVQTQNIPSTPVISLKNEQLFSSSPANNQWYFEGNLIENATEQSIMPGNGTGRYSVKVSNQCGTSSSLPFYRVITGIETENLDISVFPNPTQNYLTLIVNNYSIETVIVYNILGIKLKEIENLKNIDISEFPPGQYYIKLIATNGQVLVKKIIKI